MVERYERMQNFCRWAALRDGVFTRADATEFGLTDFDLRQGTKRGHWTKFHGVYLMRDQRDSPTAELRAALAHCGPSALATGPHALELYGFDQQQQLELLEEKPFIQLSSNRHVQMDGVIMIRDRRGDSEAQIKSGISLVSPGKAVVDCLRFMEAEKAKPILYRALQLRWIDTPALEYWVDRLYRHNGLAQLRAHLDDAKLGSHAESERKFALLLRRNHITNWSANLPLYDAEGLIGICDFVFADIKLVIEIDGRAWHTDAYRFQKDRTRQNRLIKAGYTVLRFTWDDLLHRSTLTIKEVKSTVSWLKTGAKSSF